MARGVVEASSRRTPRQPSYIELEVSPLGTLLDIYLLDRRKPLRYESWNSAGVSWAVRVEGKVDGRGGDRGWTCEIALPLEDVVTAPHLPPRPGDRWRMNLDRVEKLPAPAGMAWSPTRRELPRPLDVRRTRLHGQARAVAWCDGEQR